MKTIRLYFPFFNTNQLFSPILGEYKNAKKRLDSLGLDIQSQLKRRPRVPSKYLPCGVHITYYICKDNFDPTTLCILTHKILCLLELHTILQSVNNKTVRSISFEAIVIKKINDEGCDIDFITD